MRSSLRLRHAASVQLQQKIIVRESCRRVRFRLGRKDKRKLPSKQARADPAHDFVDDSPGFGKGGVEMSAYTLHYHHHRDRHAHALHRRRRQGGQATDGGRPLFGCRDVSDEKASSSRRVPLSETRDEKPTPLVSPTTVMDASAFSKVVPPKSSSPAVKTSTMSRARSEVRAPAEVPRVARRGSKSPVTIVLSDGEFQRAVT